MMVRVIALPKKIFFEKELFLLVVVSKFGDCILILPFRSDIWY